ncbi:MAG: methyltransferase, partial [Candidatus Marinimicrobia bacterium]|nr:methyltransferase [Candidatus Neomarinimicrobiota bacterium]
MNSRERVLAAINHEPVDRIPIDFGGHRSSGIMAMAYARLKEYMGIREGAIYVYDLPQQLAIVEPVVLDEMGVDVIEMGRGFLLDENDWKDWVLPDGTPCKIPNYIQLEEKADEWYLLAKNGRVLAVQKQGTPFMEQIYFPMADRDFENEDFADIEEQFKYSMWTGIATPGGHLPMDEAGLKKLADGARKLRQSTDKAIVGLFGGNLFEIPQLLFRMENFLTYMGLYPEAVLRLTKKLYEIHLVNLEKWLVAVGDYIDVILFGDDFGTQTGPFFSNTMYRKFYKPFQQSLWKRVKDLANVKIMLHSCGAIEPLLDDLIDAGLEAINPVQISCRG